MRVWAWGWLVVIVGCGDVDGGRLVDADVRTDVAAETRVDGEADAPRETTAPETTTPETTTPADSETRVDAEADVAEDVAPATEVTLAPETTGPEVVIDPGCFRETTAGHHAVTCGDIVFEVEVPDACLVPGACGLIVDIHGFTMNAAAEDANTDMRRRGREAGYVVIQPSAPSPLGVPAWDLETSAGPIFAFVAEVADDLGTDPGRAHVMGFSQGGALTWTLVCEHADFFASAAPIGALPGCDFSATEHPSREVDLLIVHGHDDTVVAYSNLETQRDAALTYWQAGQSVVIEADDGHEALRWITPEQTTIEVWSHDYTATSFLLNGHCFPGSPDVTAQGLALAFGCQQTGTFDYAALALGFFVAHSR